MIYVRLEPGKGYEARAMRSNGCATGRPPTAAPRRRRPVARGPCGRAGGAVAGAAALAVLPLTAPAAMTGPTGVSDVGIDDGFVNRIKDSTTPGTSALFVLTSDAVRDRAEEAFAG
jgi:hypothetical protein